MNNETNNYKYPVGDFLSGFSDDSNNPCEYELECQRMVIRGVQYLDDNQELVDKIANEKLGVYDEALKPMIEHMCYPEDDQTGAMVGHTVKVAYHAKKLGWDAILINPNTSIQQIQHHIQTLC
jgi:hypothetical protein